MEMMTSYFISLTTCKQDFLQKPTFGENWNVYVSVRLINRFSYSLQHSKLLLDIFLGVHTSKRKSIQYSVMCSTYSSCVSGHTYYVVRNTHLSSGKKTRGKRA